MAQPRKPGGVGSAGVRRVIATVINSPATSVATSVAPGAVASASTTPLAMPSATVVSIVGGIKVKLQCMCDSLCACVYMY